MCKTQAVAEMGGGINIQARELLPANVVPRHYHVTLEPDFEKFNYAGTVVIDLDVVDDSKSISLHSLEIEVHSAKITSGGETVRFVCALCFASSASQMPPLSPPLPLLPAP